LNIRVYCAYTQYLCNNIFGDKSIVQYSYIHCYITFLKHIPLFTYFSMSFFYLKNSLRHCRTSQHFFRGELILIFFKYFIQHCFICRPSDSGGAWERTQDCCDFGIGSQVLSSHSVRSHPIRSIIPVKIVCDRFVKCT
jgi:hypothetical protein